MHRIHGREAEAGEAGRLNRKVERAADTGRPSHGEREMQRKVSRRVTAGETYGKIRVVSSDKDSGTVGHNCKCLACGKEFRKNGQWILKNRQYGCPECAGTARTRKREQEAWEKYGGMRFGELEVKEILGIRPYSAGKRVMFVRCECSCRNTVDLPLVRLKQGKARTCGHGAAGNLKAGQELAVKACVEGTDLYAISGQRKTNKNSATGHNGVSQFPNGKYRAYINFKRRQYHLGTYEKLEDAVDARKEAEEHIYGDFLRWYEKEHPEEFRKIYNKGK